ncbi:MAG: hypothetical protein ACLS89_04380 [Collinsella sp.]
MRTIGMSDYTVGEDCFDELPAALASTARRKSPSLVASEPWPRRCRDQAALEGTDVEFWRRASTAPTVRVPISPRS